MGGEGREGGREKGRGGKDMEEEGIGRGGRGKDGREGGREEKEEWNGKGGERNLYLRV